MTRFLQELSGELGQYWRTEALKEIERIQEDYFDGKITVKDGVAYNCVGRVVMADMAEKMLYSGIEFDIEKTAQAREEEVARELAEYRKAQAEHEYSEEEMFEMRAAFGAGATIVNVFTGKMVQV